MAVTTVAKIVGAGSAIDQSAIAVTGGTISGVTITQSNVAYVLSQSAIPFFMASTGSMGNNGALTAMTAFAKTYSGGLYLYFPANAIVAGSAAGWYWTVMSSTTAGTVYNSVYTSGTPARGVTTAFVTTGPGAFTGATTEVAGQVISVPAGALGANGQVDGTVKQVMNNTAGTKSMFVHYSALGGTSYTGISSLASQLGARYTFDFSNTGVTNAQVGSFHYVNSAGAAVGAVVAVGTVDTTAATTIVIGYGRSVATDNNGCEGYKFLLSYAA